MTCYEYQLLPLHSFLTDPKVPDGYRWVRSEEGYAVLERVFEDQIQDQITIYDGPPGPIVKAPKGATPPILPTLKAILTPKSKRKPSPAPVAPPAPKEEQKVMIGGVWMTAAQVAEYRRKLAEPTPLPGIDNG